MEDSFKNLESFKESVLEKVIDNTGTNIAATLLAICSGNPIAALLPILTTSLASGRHKKRVESAIKEIEEILIKQDAKLKDITDSQYKVINETILSIFQTVEKEKFEYLRNVIQNTIDEKDITPYQAVLLSRIVRDISVQEVKFLLENIKYKGIKLGNKLKESQEDNECLYIKRNSQESLIVSGLISLGLLGSGEATWGGLDTLWFSPICKKLISVLNTQSNDL